MIGRAARNLNGTVILYADRMTDSLKQAIEETNRWRATQEAFNTEHGIEPRTIVKDIASPLLQLSNLDCHDAAAKRLEFEEAAQLRDRIKEPRAQQIYKT
jgi:excinuclease ABC subunit B